MVEQVVLTLAIQREFLIAFDRLSFLSDADCSNTLKLGWVGDPESTEPSLFFSKPDVFHLHEQRQNLQKQSFRRWI